MTTQASPIRPPDDPYDAPQGFRLHNNTLLGGILCHLQSQVRERGRLIMEAADHPDLTPEQAAELLNRPAAKAIRDEWEVLRRDLWKVLNLQLKPFNELVAAGGPVAGNHGPCGRDPLRTTMRQLKHLADKARLKDPTITLMKSWDLNSLNHQPPEPEEIRLYRR